MNSGNIKVVEPNDNYKRIHKSLIRNENIDCLTLGVYTKIMLFGSEWELNIKGLSKVLGLSEPKIRKCIGILEGEGYIKRIANYHDGKLDGWNYEIYAEPIKTDSRSRAGYKIENEEDFIQCCAESSVTQNQTTLESDMTENGEDNNIRLNKIKDLINNNTEKENDKEESLSKKKDKNAIDMSMVSTAYLPIMTKWLEYKKEKKQTYKQKGFVTCYNSLVKMSGNDPQLADYIVERSMANNWAGLFPIKSDEIKAYQQQSNGNNTKNNELLLQRFYGILGDEEADIYGMDRYAWHMLTEQQKNYHRKQDDKKKKMLEWIEANKGK